jgi:hypothetical protein
VSGSWAGSMQAALAASVGRPRWWVMALAAFLVRGGILVVLLPLVTLPSAAALATVFGPTIETIAMSRLSAEAALVGTAVLGAFVAVIGAAAWTGSWLDNALAREAGVAEELDLRPALEAPSAWHSLSIRFVAHLPTLIALAYAAVRLVIVTYQDFISPGDPAVPMALRVLSRAPDVVVVTGVAWLFGEAIGGLAARRAAEGDTIGGSLRGAFGDLVARRGVVTFVITDVAVFGCIVLLLAVVGQATAHVRAYLLEAAPSLSIAAALLLLVTTWVLALAVLGFALAWRATAWTVAAAPRRAAEVSTAAVEETPASWEAPAG